MITKLLEIRDQHTFIPILAIRFDSENEPERWLLSRAGYGKLREDHQRYVLLCQISGGMGACHCDPYDWGGRTYPVAHDYIIKNFDALKSGDVIDVEFILGETAEPKASERLGQWGGLA